TYEHKHVLRDAINSTWGEEVLTGSNLPGDTLTVPIPSYTLDNGWVGDNCSLVAYVYNNVTREVMQVTERKFVP
ncbi:MAG: Omp28-related outer membrane protein, partial [Flavobacteriales bacterium]|nr:Omp28-related outer membrane protein [Flavobacteriales bacterium]